jgi:anti-sigma B factor antagonist
MLHGNDEPWPNPTRESEIPEHGRRLPISLPARQSATSGDRAQPTSPETSRSSSAGGRLTGSARGAETSDPEPFAIEVQRRDHVTTVRPRGELDIATVETLRTALGAAIAETLRAPVDGFESPARLLVDLRRLSFIDSAALHLLVALDQRAQRDGLQLTLLAPAAPVDRAIRLCGLDQVLPFAAPDDTVDTEPGESPLADRGRQALRDVS